MPALTAKTTRSKSTPRQLSPPPEQSPVNESLVSARKSRLFGATNPNPDRKQSVKSLLKPAEDEIVVAAAPEKPSILKKTVHRSQEAEETLKSTKTEVSRPEEPEVAAKVPAEAAKETLETVDLEVVKGSVEAAKVAVEVVKETLESSKTESVDLKALRESLGGLGKELMEANALFQRINGLLRIQNGVRSGLILVNSRREVQVTADMRGQF